MNDYISIAVISPAFIIAAIWLVITERQERRRRKIVKRITEV